MAIDLTYVDELIAARQKQHGGKRGAPNVENGHRIGTSLNRSCMVILSALLQAFIEEEFEKSARHSLPLLNNDDIYDRYWKQMKLWGNPSAANIKNLFLKIGMPDVLASVAWQGTTPSHVRTKLDEINTIRNQVAHGAQTLKLYDRNFSLTLQKISGYRNFVDNFANRFSQHLARNRS